MGHITVLGTLVVTVRVTLEVTVGDTLGVTARGHITAVIRAQLQSRLAIGLTTFTAPAITEATHITSGSADIGHRGTAKECGSTAITLCEDIDRAERRADQDLNNGFGQAQAGQTETHCGCQAT
jgi:hypothetical protein